MRDGRTNDTPETECPSPGLVERRLVKEHTPTCVEIEETWDVSVAGCPVIVVDLQTLHVNKEAVRVTRRVLMDKREWTYGQTTKSPTENG